jgi:hypothetical protein
MIEIIKRDMAVSYLRHYVRTYMISQNISDTKEAMEKIIQDMPILMFSSDANEKIGANFISKNRFLFTHETLYPTIEETIRDFDNLFNTEAKIVNKILPVETYNFVNIFHKESLLKELFNTNDAGTDDTVFSLFPKKIEWGNVNGKIFSEDFIEANAATMNWRTISRQKNLSEAFMTRNADKLNMEIISKTQVLSEDFMELHKTQLSWNELSTYQVMSEEFMVKHSDSMN